jgi:hypothetical protein
MRVCGGVTPQTSFEQNKYAHLARRHTSHNPLLFSAKAYIRQLLYSYMCWVRLKNKYFSETCPTIMQKNSSIFHFLIIKGGRLDTEKELEKCTAFKDTGLRKRPRRYVLCWGASSKVHLVRGCGLESEADASARSRKFSSCRETAECKVLRPLKWSGCTDTASEVFLLQGNGLVQSIAASKVKRMHGHGRGGVPLAGKRPSARYRGL